jgi:AraC-like DNA-binding protein
MLDEYLRLCSSGHFYNMPTHHAQRSRPMDYLLIWVLGGSGFARTENKTLSAKAGSLLSFRPGAAHEYGADPREPWNIVWVHYQGRLAKAFTDVIRGFGGPHVALGLDDQLRDRWLELVAAHLPRDPRGAVRVNTALYALLGMVIHRLQQRAQVRPATDALNLHCLQTYIRQHLTESITLADLARQVNLSPTHFARVFKQQVGISPINYVIQKRIMQGGSLLTETNQPLKQIAAAVGYEDPFYFSRLFKKTIGVSPAAFRQAERGQRARRPDPRAPSLPVTPPAGRPTGGRKSQTAAGY